MASCGVNWTTSIMGLKFLNRQGSGTTADAINAIEYAIQARKARNQRACPLEQLGRGAELQALLQKINDADGAGMLFVAAAGNNGKNIDDTPHYPASYDAANVVAVAATDSSDALASWSNYGTSCRPGCAWREHLLYTPQWQIRHDERHVDGHAARLRSRGAGPVCVHVQRSNA